MWVARLEGGPRKVNHAAVTIDDKIYCFGGYCSGEDHEINRPMEICVLDTDTLRWKVLPPTAGFDETAAISDVPFHRYGHSAVAWKHLVLIWGGRNDSSGSCNTLYCYDTHERKWTRPVTSGETPEKRDGHSVALLGDVMYIFGGFEENGDRYSADIFSLHIPTMTWIPVYSWGDRPTPRDFATLEVIGERLYLWGGRGDTDPQGLHTGEEVYENAMYVFDTCNNEWSRLASDTSPPPPRRSHASWVYHGKLYIFGGYNGYCHYGDTWTFDPATMSWNELDFGCSPCRPNPRRRMACRVAGDRMFLFGGTSPHPLGSPAVPVNAEGLHDHDDMYVLEFMPRLKILAMVAMLKYRMDTDNLPTVLRLDFLFHTLSNTVNRQQRIRHPAGNHSG
ncbi:Kelch domain-containing protein 3 [Hypsibius exemplaris]|uniref:Kelch domain-containing protein 3 n=1 Tax=Hypsibius exemplaris TaxID=2072580 RepID=A0A1W0WZJ4_HYPEX|nr:Kelch domain-containing protein 3 [Hypsibius exemplaris]